MNKYITELLVTSLFAFALFGYPLVASIGVLFNLNNQLLVIPYRALIVIIALLTFSLKKIYLSNIRIKSIKLIFGLCLFYFIFLLIIRSLLDTIFYLNHIQLSIKIQFWTFLLFVSLLPSISFALYNKYTSEYCLLKSSINVGLCAASVSLYTYLTKVSFDISMLFAGRMDLGDVLNPITIGHMGLSLMVLAYVFLTRYRGFSTFNTIKAIFAFFIGSILLIAAGSRGPFLSLIIIFLFIFFMSGSVLKKIFYITLFTVLLKAFLYFSDIYIFERLKDSLFKDEARDTILIESFRLIEQNYIFGAGILSFYTYPHNILVESFLILGIFGFILFVIIFIINYYYTYKVYKKGLNIIFPLIYLQYSIYSLVSGTIIEAAIFWMLTFCYLTYDFDKSRIARRNEFTYFSKRRL